MERKESDHVVISLSGGLDSTTLLTFILNLSRWKQRKSKVETVSFHYGSKHNDWEIESAKRIAEYYEVRHTVLDLGRAFAGFKSNLLKTGGPIPEGHYEDKTMSQTVVPCRNLIFASILAGLAESRGASHIAIAVHAGDHTIYPDCRPQFIRSLDTTILEATENNVTLLAPFLQENKSSIVRIGLELKTPFHLTRTCYKDQPVACGRCGSCMERREAFANNGRGDPLDYADNAVE